MWSWLPFGLSCAVLVGVVLHGAQGGLERVRAWYLAQLLWPLAGVVCLGFAGYWWFVGATGSVVIATAVVGVVGLLPLFQMSGLWQIAYPADIDEVEPSATVRLPADGPLTVAWGGDPLETNRHAAMPDQRWAYDFMRPPAALHGSSELSDYGCYGIPVVAPAAGEVVLARDGIPDAEPGELSRNYDNPTGNAVALELEETGTYLILAHLKTDTVAVEVGDTVEEGDVLGECGNSGNTSEPHIHIHHQRQNPDEYPGNFGEGLPLYFRDHDGPPMPSGGIDLEGDEPELTGHVVEHDGGG